jgi:hypothetical protein
MSLILWIFLPICCAVTGKLLGGAISASYFFREPGRRLGRIIGSWCAPVFPMIYLIAMYVGASGNAGRGFRLFGSELLFDLACAVPFYAIPILGAYVGAIYVIRDLTMGHREKTKPSTE